MPRLAGVGRERTKELVERGEPKQTRDAIAGGNEYDMTSDTSRRGVQLGKHTNTARIHLRDQREIEGERPSGKKLSLTRVTKHGSSALDDETAATGHNRRITIPGDSDFESHRVV